MFSSRKTIADFHPALAEAMADERERQENQKVSGLPVNAEVIGIVVASL